MKKDQNKIDDNDDDDDDEEFKEKQIIDFLIEHLERQGKEAFILFTHIELSEKGRCHLFQNYSAINYIPSIGINFLYKEIIEYF